MPVDLDIVAPSITPEYVPHRLGFRQAQAGENAGATALGPPNFTVTRIDEYTIQLDFASAVYDLPTLRWTGAYTVVPAEPNALNLDPLVVEAVAVMDIVDGTPYDSTSRVILTTSEQGPSDYDVTVFGLERV